MSNMSKRLTLATLFHRPPAVAERPTQDSTAEPERLKRELKTAELETRFREALASGKSTGDIITTDEHGNIVPRTKNTNIFDL